MPARFVVWSSAYDENSACVVGLDGLDDPFELKRAISRSKGYPKGVRIEMDVNRPNGMKLLDNVENLERLIIASTRLTDFLRAQQLQHVEYLPIAILNHKGRVASKDYFIVHPTSAQDVLDEKNSGAKRSKIRPSNVSQIDQLVIDEARVDPNVELFRIRSYWAPILVSRRLAEAVTANKFTGLRWIETADYPED